MVVFLHNRIVIDGLECSMELFLLNLDESTLRGMQLKVSIKLECRHYSLLI